MTGSRAFAFALALLFAVLLLNGGLAYHNVGRLLDAQRGVSRTLEVRHTLAQLDAAVVSAETSERGFALTGQAAFLAQHADAVRDVRADLATLRNLTADNRAHAQRLERVSADASKALAWFAQVIAARQRGGLDAAQAIVAEGRGAALTARVRLGLEEIDREEAALLRTHTSRAATNLKWTMAGLGLLTAASVLLVVLVLRAIRRETAGRLQSQHELFRANGMLRSILDTIPQRVFWKDRESRYLGGNRLFARDAGYERPEDIIGKTDSELFTSARAAEYRADDVTVMNRRVDKLRYEEQISRKDGSTGWVETSKVPLRDIDGRVVGVLGTYQDITERKASADELERQANYDALTGLPNRNLLSDRIDHAIAHAKRAREAFALAVMDLDNFKLANDGHGHHFGDQLLCEAARRVSDAVRADDTVARYGGDEFVLLLSCRGNEQFAGVLERVRAAMAKPFKIDGTDYFCTCSIGATTFPHDGADGTTLLSNADAAMYRAKEGGRNRIEVFERHMGERIRERIEIEHGLRVALEEGQFFLHYQPQLNLNTGRIHGVEALIRWNQPGRGLISPARFIPVAEQSGLIIPLGAWILRTACAQAKRWNDGPWAPLTVAVNLSALQFRQQGFVQLVEDTLSETGAAPQHLDFEITESLLMSEADDALRVLDQLGALGIRLSVDDFGTGFSSLSYLKRLPVQKLKIDQSFVRDIPSDANDVAIARAIASLSHSLDLHVIAEGVETEEQFQCMRDLECDEIQGYYLSRPVAAEELDRFLSMRAAS